MLDTLARDHIDRLPIEAPRPFFPVGDIVLGPGIRESAKGAAFEARTATDGAENWRLRDVTLLPAFGLVFRDGEIVDGTDYLVYPRDEARIRDCLARPRARLPGRHFFGGSNRLFENHFHLLHQILPAIAGYHLAGLAGGTLIQAKTSPVLARARDLAGFAAAAAPRVDPWSPLDIDDLTVSSFLYRPDGLSPFRLSVFDAMARRATRLHPHPGEKNRMIYVWRADSPARPMRNEDDLVDRLARNFGVEPVVLSLLDLDEQISLFHDSRVVIGPHGAGLGNVVFCAPGAVVYELLPDHYLNPCVNRLAQLRGVHYWCDAHPAEARTGLWRHQTPWTVDIDAVERRVAEMLSAYPIG